MAEPIEVVLGKLRARAQAAIDDISLSPDLPPQPSKPTRCPKVSAWWHNPIRSAISMATVLASPPVDDVTHAARMAECRACPDATARGERLYCGCCGCGEHRAADLYSKNRYSAHTCPVGMF